ncbi:MAG: hypothetical protein QOH46_335, partial [Solirubrobacteraceae bacterium]|nr:hypothetical protein [Solirubrobacteraceae bacterium]
MIDAASVRAVDGSRRGRDGASVQPLADGYSFAAIP